MSNRTSRRSVLKGATASASLIVCEAIAKPVTDVLIPRLGCGCPRIHELSYGHTCTIHDERGKRWDSYTINEIDTGLKLDVQTGKTEWSCYCGRHEDNVMPVGTICLWRRTSYECDEWECDCAESYRDSWLDAVTTDWIAMAKQDGFA